MRQTMLLLVGIGLAPGCADTRPVVEVSGYPIVKEYWDGIDNGVRPKAAFTLACPPEELQLNVLDADQNTTDYWFVRQVAVSGCGKRAIYVTSRNGWILSYSSDNPRL